MQLQLCQCCSCGPRASKAPEPSLQRQFLPSLSRTTAQTRKQRGSTVTCNFAGAAAPILGSSGLALSASELVSVFSFALGSIVLGGLLLTDQTKRQGPNPECSTCEGTGVVSCVCNRWSDGDRGCSICRGTGKMACPSCGGGGTAVPIAARVEITRQPSLMDQQQQ